ncbi:MAG: ComEC/Rec2 family competence protein [Corallococcus sp.]|nr:ComEC/Rec2 family competence protein [Corallococcus sp.]MCM1359427.1 ComEC/Rec2 family competence protein [Corallococcus sp.]MCM1394761.1 ComEC/Rec2 family competence protein [Corallococcus sp.]
MRKLVNLRFSLLCVLGLIVGIVSFHELLFGNFWPLVVCCSVVTVGGIVFAFLKRKIWISCLVILVFICAGFFNFMFRYNARNQDSNECRTGVLSGRVSDIERNGDVSNVLYLDNCVFENGNVKGVVKVYVYSGGKYCTGDSVTIHGTLRNAYSIKNVVDTSDIRRNIYYEFTDTTPINIESGALNLGEKIRLYIYNVTMQFMPQNGDVAYALITGDRNALDETKTEAFQSAGIIHLLVVSGLHVNFIVFLFGFLLEKLKVKAYIQLPVLLVPLLFYAYVCSYTPSVLRAIIMTVCLYTSRIVHGKYDLLSSLFWAMTVILTFQPAYVFDIGFQLSAMSVFGIATVYLRINRALMNRKINRFVRKFISTVSLSFSCVVATLFFNAYYFSSVALLGIIVNVFAIPMTFLSFVLTVVGLIPWVFHYSAWLADKIIFAVTFVAKGVSGLNASLPVEAIAAAMIISPLFLFIVGGYVNLPKIPYRVSVAVCIVSLAICVITPLIPKNCDNCVKVFFGYGDTIVVTTSVEGETVLVGEFDDDYTLQKALDYLSDKKIKSAKVFCVKFNDFKEDLFVKMTEDVSVAAIYKLDFSGNNPIENLVGDKIPIIQAYPNAVHGKNITVQPVYDGGLVGVVVKVDKISVALITENGVKAAHFADLRQDVNYYIVNDQLETFSDKNFVTLSLYQNDISGNFGANKYGNFTITEKDDTIRLNFRRN